jgi:hypothetical protein
VEVNPVIQQPPAARRDLWRSESEDVESNHAMKDKERDGPAHLLCPEHPGSKIAVQRVTVDQTVLNG